MKKTLMMIGLPFLLQAGDYKELGGLPEAGSDIIESVELRGDEVIVTLKDNAIKQEDQSAAVAAPSCTEKVKSFFYYINKHKAEFGKILLSAGAYCGATYLASKVAPPHLAPVITGAASMIAVFNRTEIRFLIEDSDARIRYPFLAALTIGGYVSDIFSGVPLGLGNLALNSLGNQSKRAQKEEKKKKKEAKLAKKAAKQIEPKEQ